MPVGKPTISRAGVVSPQDLCHEEKEFSQTPLFQGPGDRVPALAFAEGVTLHMRVRHIIATTGATRIESDHGVRLVAAELIQREPDFERAEVDFFENDPFRPDAESFGEPVHFDVIELVQERLQFLQQQPECGNLRLRLVTFQVFSLMQTILRQSAQRLRELSAKMGLSGDEAESIGELQSALQLLDSEPVFVG